MRSFIITYLFLFNIYTAFAQLSFDTLLSPLESVNTYLINENASMVIKNVSYFGNRSSYGGFKDPSKYAVINKGLMLSTGDIYDAKGPNNSEYSGRESSNLSDRELEKIAKGKSYDAAVLIIDFIPITDSISFEYFFASEEYPEYVNKGVNDVFAFFLSLDSSNSKNLAVLKNTNTPISVDNINARKNSDLYIQNDIWRRSEIMKYENNRARGERSLQYQFDGFTQLLQAGSKVIAGQSYQLKIAVADIGDRFYDSAVFLKSGSFDSKGDKKTDSTYLKRLVKNMNWDITPNFSESINNEFRMSFKINYETDKYQIRTDMKATLVQLVELLKADQRLKINIIGHTDNVASAEYNQNLSEKRAETIYNFLISSGIAPNRLNYEGKGASKPLFANTSEASRLENRRVEFIFTLD